MIESTQVDFQAAVLGYSDSGDAYEHYYSVLANIGSSDLNDSYANNAVQNPCDSNPCLNDGTCQIGLLGNFVCVCPEYVIGI